VTSDGGLCWVQKRGSLAAFLVCFCINRVFMLYMFEAGCYIAFMSSHFQQLVGTAAWLNCPSQCLWCHTLHHSRAPGNPGNEVCAFPIPGNEKTGPGMQTLITMTRSIYQCNFYANQSSGLGGVVIHTHRNWSMQFSVCVTLNTKPAYSRFWQIRVKNYKYRGYRQPRFTGHITQPNFGPKNNLKKALIWRTSRVNTI